MTINKTKKKYVMAFCNGFKYEGYLSYEYESCHYYEVEDVVSKKLIMLPKACTIVQILRNEWITEEVKNE